MKKIVSISLLSFLFLSGCQNNVLEYEKPIKTDSTETAQVQIEKDCINYFDGCNDCTVKDGQMDGCTRKFCPEDLIQDAHCTQKSIREEDSNLIIDVQYPATSSSKLNMLISNFIQEQIEEIRIASNEMLDLPADDPNTQAALYITNNESNYGENIKSYELIISVNTGGAHPNTTLKTFTYDFINEKIITIDDFFRDETDYLSALENITQSKLKTQLGEIIDEDWLKEGTGTNPENYANFMLSNDKLTIIFSPYQVAAYAAGIQTVEIPLTELADFLKPEFIPGI